MSFDAKRVRKTSQIVEDDVRHNSQPDTYTDIYMHTSKRPRIATCAQDDAVEDFLGAATTSRNITSTTTNSTASTTTTTSAAHLPAEVEVEASVKEGVREKKKKKKKDSNTLPPDDIDAIFGDFL